MSAVGIVPKSVPQARQALAAMERDVESATTYAEIRQLEQRAEALKALYREYEEVRRDAERVILVAQHRVGEELKQAPVNKGALKQGPRRAESDTGIPTLAEQVGSQDKAIRLKQLAEVSRNDLLSAAATLWEAGKEATQTAVLRLLRPARARREMRETELGAKQLALPDKVYGVLYVDPPWKFEVYSEDTGQGRAAEAHYPTMPSKDIADIPVPSIAADDCVLFLWATAPTLPQALELLKAWGFAYKTHCIWVKDKIGLGFWFRNQHEILIVAVKGAIPAPAHGTQCPSVITAPRGRHSEKPVVFHELIEGYFPSLPKIELFARARRPGWDRWGNEAPSDEEESDDDDI
jgi:N6-adenosine-specific RNA methylase IME4